MLQEDIARFLLWLCLLPAHCHEPQWARSPSSRSFRLFKILSCFPPWHLPPAVIYHPCGCFGFIALRLVIFLYLEPARFPVLHRGASLAESTLFATSKSQINTQLSLVLGRDVGRARHPRQRMAERASRFRRPRRSLRRGLWPAAVCDLWAASRPSGGRGLGFPWGHAGSPPASVWGAGM